MVGCWIKVRAERLFGALAPQEIRLNFVPACNKRGPSSVLSHTKNFFDTKNFKAGTARHHIVEQNEGAGQQLRYFGNGLSRREKFDQSPER
jgi:hypothetical protein